MLLFDMDGTLLDSNGVWQEVDTAFLAKRGIPYTKDYYEGVAHTIFPLAAKFTKAFCQLPETEEEIMAEWMEMAGDLYATDVAAKPGVTTFLDAMQARGERMAVVTSARAGTLQIGPGPFGAGPLFRAGVFRPGVGHGEERAGAVAGGGGGAGGRAGGMRGVRRFRGGVPGREGCGMKTVGVHDPFFAGTEGDMKTLCDRYITGWDELL